MIKINVMRTFLNRLKDRGWKNIIVKWYTDNDNQVLRRGEKNIIVIDSINVDSSVDIKPQIDEVFKNLIETIKRFDAKEIFLPGGGDILIPEFFENFCRENGISIHIITIELLREFLNYN
jgi:hypothetical protein